MNFREHFERQVLHCYFRADVLGWNKRRKDAATSVTIYCNFCSVSFSVTNDPISSFRPIYYSILLQGPTRGRLTTGDTGFCLLTPFGTYTSLISPIYIAMLFPLRARRHKDCDEQSLFNCSRVRTMQTAWPKQTWPFLGYKRHLGENSNPYKNFTVLKIINVMCGGWMLKLEALRSCFEFPVL